MRLSIETPPREDPYVVDVENVAVGELALRAAAQIDAHREGAWTLRIAGSPVALDPRRNVDELTLRDGDMLTLERLR